MVKKFDDDDEALIKGSLEQQAATEPQSPSKSIFDVYESNSIHNLFGDPEPTPSPKRRRSLLRRLSSRIISITPIDVSPFRQSKTPSNEPSPGASPTKLTTQHITFVAPEDSERLKQAVTARQYGAMENIIQRYKADPALSALLCAQDTFGSNFLHAIAIADNPKQIELSTKLLFELTQLAPSLLDKVLAQTTFFQHGEKTPIDLLLANPELKGAVRQNLATLFVRSSHEALKVGFENSNALLEILISKRGKENIGINEKDPSDGSTPLHKAIFKGDLEAVKTLLLHGATLQYNKKGYRPLNYAKHRRDKCTVADQTRVNAEIYQFMSAMLPLRRVENYLTKKRPKFFWQRRALDRALEKAAKEDPKYFAQHVCRQLANDSALTNTQKLHLARHKTVLSSDNTKLTHLLSTSNPDGSSAQVKRAFLLNLKEALEVPDSYQSSAIRLFRGHSRALVKIELELLNGLDKEADNAKIYRTYEKVLSTLERRQSSNTTCKVYSAARFCREWLNRAPTVETPLTLYSYTPPAFHPSKLEETRAPANPETSPEFKEGVVAPTAASSERPTLG